jgi:hypothetical protein
MAFLSLSHNRPWAGNSNIDIYARKRQARLLSRQFQQMCSPADTFVRNILSSGGTPITYVHTKPACLHENIIQLDCCGAFQVMNAVKK